MSFADWLLKILSDKRRPVRKRLTYLLLVLFALLLLNNYLGFTYYYKTSRKLELMKEVAALQKDTSLMKSGARLYVDNILHQQPKLTEKVLAGAWHFTGGILSYVGSIFRTEDLYGSASPHSGLPMCGVERFLHFWLSNICLILVFFYNFSWIGRARGNLGLKLVIFFIQQLLIIGGMILFFWLFAFLSCAVPHWVLYTIQVTANFVMIYLVFFHRLMSQGYGFKQSLWREADVKTSMVLASLRGEKFKDIAEEYGVETHQVRTWRNEFLKRAHIVFEEEMRERKRKEELERLYLEIGELTMQNEYLRNVAVHDTRSAG